MALLGASRREREKPAKLARAAPTPATISSRLLPGVLDESKLAKLGTLNILDFGRANSASLEFFNHYPCRLCVLDAADGLLNWSESVEQRTLNDEAPSQLQLQHELGGLLRAMDGHRYDLVFLWDTLNHLHETALPAFSALLRRHLTPTSRGHGFMLHKRDAHQRMRRMGLGGVEEILLLEESDARLFPHTRKAVTETLEPDLQIDHAVLHGDGRLEYLLSATSTNKS